jgi:hypothetical protein
MKRGETRTRMMTVKRRRRRSNRRTPSQQSPAMRITTIQIMMGTLCILVMEKSHRSDDPYESVKREYPSTAITAEGYLLL